MQKTILEILNVSKSFGKTKVIDNVNLSIQEGEIFGFLGPNGAGKTTTIKMILGLLSIDEGNIIINGYDVKNDFEKAMEYIGAIVENPDMYGYMSGMDNLKLYARIRNVDKSRIDEVVKLVDLKDKIDRNVCKYSLGMKQRLGLALTLLHKPKILILDEPTNGLDPAGIRKLRDILKNLSHNYGVSIFISSHLLSEMQLMCDKVAIIDNGKIIKIESLKEVLSNATEQEKIKVNMTVLPIENINNILSKIVSEDDFNIEDKKLILNIYKSQIPQIVKKIVENNIDVYEINIKENSLEDAFLDITSGGDK